MDPSRPPIDDGAPTPTPQPPPPTHGPRDGDGASSVGEAQRGCEARAPLPGDAAQSETSLKISNPDLIDYAIGEAVGEGLEAVHQQHIGAQLTRDTALGHRRDELLRLATLIRDAVDAFDAQPLPEGALEAADAVVRESTIPRAAHEAARARAPGGVTTDALLDHLEARLADADAADVSRRLVEHPPLLARYREVERLASLLRTEYRESPVPAATADERARMADVVATAAANATASVPAAAAPALAKGFTLTDLLDHSRGELEAPASAALDEKMSGAPKLAEAMGEVASLASLVRDAYHEPAVEVPAEREREMRALIRQSSRLHRHAHKRATADAGRRRLRDVITLPRVQVALTAAAALLLLLNGIALLVQLSRGTPTDTTADNPSVVGAFGTDTDSTDEDDAVDSTNTGSDADGGETIDDGGAGSDSEIVEAPDGDVDDADGADSTDTDGDDGTAIDTGDDADNGSDTDEGDDGNDGNAGDDAEQVETPGGDDEQDTDTGTDPGDGNVPDDDALDADADDADTDDTDTDPNRDGVGAVVAGPSLRCGSLSARLLGSATVRRHAGETLGDGAIEPWVDRGDDPNAGSGGDSSHTPIPPIMPDADSVDRPVGWHDTEPIALHARGDVNGDGRVDGKDNLILLRAVLDGSVESLGSEADVNGDGKANFKDVMVLTHRLQQNP